MGKVFHISRHYIGDEKLFIPRVPVSQNKSEINMPKRICASKEIEGCWMAISCCSDLVLEMKANNTNGYYFFVYSFDATRFKQSSVFDAKKTGEVISENFETGVFEYAFYVSKDNLSNQDFGKISEFATKEEAVDAYNDWQCASICKMEEIIENAEW